MLKGLICGVIECHMKFMYCISMYTCTCVFACACVFCGGSRVHVCISMKVLMHTVLF
jgi:hypothetical protein